MGYLLYSLLALFIIVCFLLILLILIQKGRGGGLASAFGGGGGGSTAFGAKTGDVLTWVTSIIFGIFLLLAILLNLLGYSAQAHYSPRGPISAVAPISETPTGTPQTVPPLTTDSRPTANTPVTPSAGQAAIPTGVSAPATSRP